MKQAVFKFSAAINSAKSIFLGWAGVSGMRLVKAMETNLLLRNKGKSFFDFFLNETWTMFKSMSDETKWAI